MKRTSLMFVAALTFVAMTLMAARQEQKLAFDVASIKPISLSPPPAVVARQAGQLFMLPISVTGGRVFVRNTTVRALVQFAYRDASASPYAALYTVVDGPAFIDSDRFAVEAKSENAVSMEVARAMMRSLLEERFALKAHSETRELPVYQLVIGKGGLRMKQLPDDAGGYLRVVPEKREVLYAAPFSNIRSLAEGWADRLISDKTGLTGMFEILEADDVSNTGAATGVNNPIPRFEDQTGLRLIPAREEMKVIVIDHAERPSEN